MNNKLNNHNTDTTFIKRVVVGFLFGVYLLVSLTGMANAAPGVVVEDVDADFATGLYKETAVDMRVKIMGGFVSAKRTWYNNRWEFNYSWSDLHFEFKKSVTLPEGVPSTIRRNFMIYELVDAKADTLVWRFNDKRKTITRTATGYRWADRDGNWKEYDEDGKLLKYGDRNNVTISFTRHLNGQIEHIKDHFDKIVMTYEYNANDDVSRIVDYTGREVSYTYNAQGLLSEVKDVLGYVWKYGYKDFTVENLTGPGDLFSMGNMLTTKTDPESNVTKINYSIIGGEKLCIPTGGGYWRINPDTGLEEYVGSCTWLDSPRTLIISSIEYPDGRRQSYKFSYTGSKKLYNRVSRDASDRLVEEWIDLEGIVTRRLVNGKEEFSFIKDGTSEIITNALGHQTRTDFDQWRNPLKVTYPDQSFKSWKYDTRYSNVLEEVNENGVKTSYEYDDNGNRIRMTEAVGKPEQRVTEYTYDAYGNVLTVKRLGDAVTEEALTTYTYDDYGNVKTETISVSVSESHTINHLAYNVMGNLREWRDARNKLWKQTFDATGNRKSITNPINNSYHFDYDSLGNIVKVINPNNKPTQYVRSAGNRLDKVIDSLNGEKRYIYNEKNQLIREYDEENNPNYRDYDSHGRLNKITDGAENTTTLIYGALSERNVPHGELAAIEYPTYRQELSYDNRGRVSQVIKILGAGTQNITHQSYDAIGNITTLRDAEQRTTQYHYDALNRLINITYPTSKTVNYSYDNRDNLLSVTNENKVIIRRYVHDRKNRLAREIWPNGETYHFSYDENDNLVQKIDAKGQIVRNRFDEGDRLDQTTYYDDSASTKPIKSVAFTYNNLSKLIGYDDGQTSATFNYDDMQRRTGQSINFGEFIKTLEYTYMKNGLKESFTDPTGATVTYSYDKANRLTQISLPGEGNIIYNAYQWNAPTKVTYPGGSTRDVQYDSLMRIKQIIARDPAKNIIMNYQYNYDKVGKIQTKNTEHGDYAYDYDDRERLTSVINPSLRDEAFTYDDVGNRLTDLSTIQKWQYTSTNQLQKYGDTTLSYDANGNRVGKTTNGESNTFVYNIENRLTEVLDDSESVFARYYYDPFGQRLWKEINGVRTYFIYTQEGIVSEFDSNGNATTSYGYVPGSRYGTDPVYLRANDDIAYFQVDHLGTSQQLINKSGRVVWRGKTLGFGETYIETELVVNNLRFAGQYFDSETGNHYNYFRYYDPESGQYITSDPVDLSGGNNTYAYADNNPISLIDQFGLLPKNKQGHWVTNKPEPKPPKPEKNYGDKQKMKPRIKDLDEFIDQVFSMNDQMCAAFNESQMNEVKDELQRKKNSKKSPCETIYFQVTWSQTITIFGLCKSNFKVIFSPNPLPDAVMCATTEDRSHTMEPGFVAPRQRVNSCGGRSGSF